MKTRAQFLLMGLLSTVPLFPKESEARLFSARLIGVEEEALQQVQLSGSRDWNFSTDKENELRSFQSGCEHYLERALDDEPAVVAVPNAMRADKEEIRKARSCQL
jgi:hypothetical protein